MDFLFLTEKTKTMSKEGSWWSGWLGKPPPKPEERVKAWQRELKTQQRLIDRNIRGFFF